MLSVVAVFGRLIERWLGSSFAFFFGLCGWKNANVLPNIYVSCSSFVLIFLDFFTQLSAKAFATCHIKTGGIAFPICL